MTVWIYLFEDGTKLELSVGLSIEQLCKLVELHGKVTVDFERR